MFPNLSDIDAASDKESVEVSVDEDSEDGREFDESENEISEEHINDSGEFSEGSEVEPEEDEDMEQSRRDKVRELLSQETKLCSLATMLTKVRGSAASRFCSDGSRKGSRYQRTTGILLQFVV